MVDPSSRKRVRTGCMTCRKRRRKCDERKPECDNCIGKGLSCQYGTRLTFVASKLQDALESGARSAATQSPSSGRVSDRANTSAPDSVTTARYQGPHAHTIPNNSSLVELDHFNIDSGFEDTPGDEHVSNLGPSTSITHASSSQTHSTLFQPAHNRSLAVPNVSAGGKSRRQKYELELFIHYCYHVAPILDLGLGSLSFGVQATLDSTNLETTYHAILAVASSHRALLRPSLHPVDEATSVTSAYLAQQQVTGSDSVSASTSGILLLWRKVLVSPIESWSYLTSEMLSQMNQDAIVLEHWHVLSRLYLSASLTQASSTIDLKMRSPPHASIDGREYTHLRQSSLALWLLEETRFLFSPAAGSTEASIFPLAQTWLAHWQEVQSWFCTRSDDMQAILELGEDEDSQPQLRQNFDFPCIAFTHAAAVVANVAHHLASMILLRRKPRLIKPVAVSSSSTSSLWHAQRVIGIVATATDAEIWDPFLAAALSHAARHLSHDKQILTASQTLKRIQRMSGLNLDGAVRQIAPTALSTC
ncbi:uncharacterized protein HMPREF1541_10222 [Cyphellophora europaea CBS 101466]|uniref:Zn(2)-C6 fungal-type domain-containing protein n=1 Tax=Cyphellophora europaea (strain CBS 101466) TaxID=1220924 RepID=W2S788_CYPE1|nr:uncharacterized protein HMPREF1541_10222 [Cyphellophora europaea CBS 101466]ETN44552.1 hypothetical protein HMPREF1541_10222 [Cyphellophora europaea CBS 101466]